MMRSRERLGSLELKAALSCAGLFAFAVGCATAPMIPQESDPQALFEFACGRQAPGAQAPAGVKGSVWLNVKSKEASGKMPAEVEVKASGAVRMEVTNPFGGVEAIIHVEGNRFSIEIPREKPERRKQEGSHSWGGIPLHWAARLFQGRIPCPGTLARADMILEIPQPGELRLETKPSLDREAEVFSYRFKTSGDRPWPESLHWERKGVVPLVVDFKFDDPDAKTRSPGKWEARSAMGEVKVRWREREWVTGGHAAVDKPNGESK